MAAKADNRYDIYDWINQVIKSAKGADQISTARNLVDNYRLRYPNETSLYNNLRYYVNIKWANC